MRNITLLSGASHATRKEIGERVCYELRGKGRKVLELEYLDLPRYTLGKYYDEYTFTDLGRFIVDEEWRDNAPFVWVDYIMEVIYHLQHRYDHIVISDCRFDNEITTPKELFPNKTIHFKLIEDDIVCTNVTVPPDIIIPQAGEDLKIARDEIIRWII